MLPRILQPELGLIVGLVLLSALAEDLLELFVHVVDDRLRPRLDTRLDHSLHLVRCLPWEVADGILDARQLRMLGIGLAAGSEDLLAPFLAPLLLLEVVGLGRRQWTSV